MNNLKGVSLKEASAATTVPGSYFSYPVTSWWPGSQKAQGKMNREQSITVSLVYGLPACLTNEGGDPCSPGFHLQKLEKCTKKINTGYI